MDLTSSGGPPTPNFVVRRGHAGVFVAACLWRMHQMIVPHNLLAFATVFTALLRLGLGQGGTDVMDWAQ